VGWGGWGGRGMFSLDRANETSQMSQTFEDKSFSDVKRGCGKPCTRTRSSWTASRCRISATHAAVVGGDGFPPIGGTSIAFA
jgi:hypothetical protein